VFSSVVRRRSQTPAASPHPDGKRREELAAQVSFLRERCAQVAALLKARSIIPTMPPAVRLMAWSFKEPIAIEYHAVLTDPAKFASATLRELRERLTNPKRKYGWSVPQDSSKPGKMQMSRPPAATRKAGTPLTSLWSVIASTENSSQSKSMGLRLRQFHVGRDNHATRRREERTAMLH
jgi:hypothetical protein